MLVDEFPMNSGAPSLSSTPSSASARITTRIADSESAASFST